MPLITTSHIVCNNVNLVKVCLSTYLPVFRILPKSGDSSSRTYSTITLAAYYCSLLCITGASFVLVASAHTLGTLRTNYAQPPSLFATSPRPLALHSRLYPPRRATTTPTMGVILFTGSRHCALFELLTQRPNHTIAATTPHPLNASALAQSVAMPVSHGTSQPCAGTSVASVYLYKAGASQYINFFVLPLSYSAQERPLPQAYAPCGCEARGHAYGADGRSRTCDAPVNSRMLYQLSYICVSRVYGYDLN